MFDRITNLLNQVVESYNKISEFEVKGATKDELKNELISIRNACDELLPAIALTMKETVGLSAMVSQVNSLSKIVEVLKPTFLRTIKLQIMLLSSENTPTNPEWVKVQANLATTVMNYDDTINTFKTIIAILK